MLPRRFPACLLDSVFQPPALPSLLTTDGKSKKTTPQVHLSELPTVFYTISPISFLLDNPQILLFSLTPVGVLVNLRKTVVVRAGSASCYKCSTMPISCFRTLRLNNRCSTSIFSGYVPGCIISLTPDRANVKAIGLIVSYCSACGTKIKSTNSSRIEPVASTKRMTKGSCALFAIFCLICANREKSSVLHPVFVL
jgi:hypothetical protein